MKSRFRIVSLPGLKTGPKGAEAWLVLQRVFALPFGAKGLRGLGAGKQEAELGISLLSRPASTMKTGLSNEVLRSLFLWESF